MRILLGLGLALLPWLGAGLLLAATFHGVRKRTKLGFICLVSGAIVLLVSPPWSGPGGFSMPIVWLSMPFAAWAALACGCLVIARLAQAMLSVDTVARRPHSVSAAKWTLATGGFLAFELVLSDPIRLFIGRIPMSPATLTALAALVLASVLLMAAVHRYSARRKWPATLALNLSLLAGSALFGLPFLWMLLTSFKEQRDMDALSLVWVPKVEQTAPYLDPRDPLYEARYEGRRVEVGVASRHAGSAKVLIQRPGSLHGISFDIPITELKEIPKQIPIVQGEYDGRPVTGRVIEEMTDGHRRVEITAPSELAGKSYEAEPAQVKPVEQVGLKWQNYTDALEALPPETQNGLIYLRNTMLVVILNLAGTLASSSLVAYAFARMRFPGRNGLFLLVLSTMMLPGAVTLLPSFLIYRSLGWVDTLYPLWVPALFGSAFNIFVLRQFFLSLPSEFEDSAKIDGCGHLRSYWSVVLPQVKPALVAIALWSFIGTWGNFMGPLIYINSMKNMPISYGVALFAGDKIQFPGQLMAFATMAMLPVLVIFFLAQRYFVESISLSGFK